MSEWTETKQVFHELEQLFNREDDVNDIQDIHKMQKEVAEHCEQRLNDVREIIKAMSTMVADNEKQTMAPTPEEHAAKLREIVEKDNYQESIRQLIQAIAEKKAAIAKQASMGQVLEERMKEYSINSAMADSRTAYAISLYSKISNITWNYNAPQGHLAGCIGNDAKKEFKNFDIDISNKTSFEVTNILWDMIEAANPND